MCMLSSCVDGMRLGLAYNGASSSEAAALVQVTVIDRSKQSTERDWHSADSRQQGETPSAHHVGQTFLLTRVVSDTWRHVLH